jgi:hypothetical protein
MLSRADDKDLVGVLRYLNGRGTLQDLTTDMPRLKNYRLPPLLNDVLFPFAGPRRASGYSSVVNVWVAELKAHVDLTVSPIMLGGETFLSYEVWLTSTNICKMTGADEKSILQKALRDQQWLTGCVIQSRLCPCGSHKWAGSTITSAIKMTWVVSQQPHLKPYFVAKLNVWPLEEKM